MFLYCNYTSIYASELSTDNLNNPEEVSLELIDNNLDSENNKNPEYIYEASTTAENSLREKLKNVYNLEIEKYDQPDYLFKEVLTHKCKENSLMDNWHIWGAYNADTNFRFYENGGFDTKYESNALNIGFDGVLKNNNADFRIMLGFPVNSHRNYMQTLFSDVFIATNKIPHHRLQFGYYRPQVGYEGGNSAYTLPFYTRSQISRNFGTARKFGGRIKGDYSFFDYDLGIYSSDTFFQDFFPGAEFIAWANIKPFAGKEEKLGRLKIGGGIDGGHRNNDFFVTGGYVSWEYKRFMANFEISKANGYNGMKGYSTKQHASGFYTTVGYMITKKLQILARFDQFDPNVKINNNKNKEYTLGFNYYIKGQALKLILNYVFCQNENTKNSHRIIIGTQILI